MKKIVIIGGTNIDLLAHSDQDIQLTDSNPGTLIKSYGGVARNIAENLARLGCEPTLITVLGKDAFDFLDFANEIHLNVIYQEVDITPTYLAVHNHDGQLMVSIAAMKAMDKFQPSFLKKHHQVIIDADIIILDANLPVETIEYLFTNYKKPFYVDLISSAKAKKFYNYIPFIDTIKINALEGKEITGHSDPHQIGQVLLNKGIRSVYLTVGKDGAYHFTLDQVSYYQKPLHKPIKNDTGAGDAFYAGVIYAEIMGYDPLRTGTIMAHLSLQSDQTVNKHVSAAKIYSLLKE